MTQFEDVTAEIEALEIDQVPEPLPSQRESNMHYRGSRTPLRALRNLPGQPEYWAGEKKNPAEKVHPGEDHWRETGL